MHVEGSFEVTSWTEEEASGLKGVAKVTRTRIGQRFAGGIEADTVADMVMTYGEDGTADFVGYQRVQGRLEDKAGSFVLQAVGTYDGHEARSHFEVVAGSARGDLRDLRGSGTGVAPPGSTGTFIFDLDL